MFKVRIVFTLGKERRVTKGTSGDRGAGNAVVPDQGRGYGNVFTVIINQTVDSSLYIFLHM